MGSIGDTDSMPNGKAQAPANVNACGERILVSVRVRPLNEKEISSNGVLDWECIDDHTIIFRNSVPERPIPPTAYTFDRVFQSNSSTRQVYEEAAKHVAFSVVSGINASIFAYGQTSSGKTFTMSGITEYSVADIYEYIRKHEERAFVLKLSAIEIYNEAVRDLLSSDATPLRLLDDPEKGTIVEKLKEETLRDWNHLQCLLSVCEAQRQVGETSLNEASSRSHQILRLAVESTAREFLGKDNSSTLAASVNFVDLAGSERASQALSAGTRLKEGCHINRSLLTLGTVIRKLSKGRNSHIPYRDSKLTRILQPSLGGNARTAIICTMSPARCHIEQSRNTLAFATCANQVTTNAHVNIVMSDRALVKHLQKELARLENELRSQGAASLVDCSEALLKEKNAQIQKMEREIKELMQQRDSAQARLEDMLRVGEDLGDDHEAPRHCTANAHEDASSLPSSLFPADQPFDFDLDTSQITNKAKDCNGISPQLSANELLFSEFDSQGHVKEISPDKNNENLEELYKDVECIEVEKSSQSRLDASLGLHEDVHGKVGDSFKRLLNNPSQRKYSYLSRSRSCKGSFMDNPASSLLEMEQNRNPSPRAFEKDYCRVTHKTSSLMNGPIGNDTLSSQESDASEQSTGPEIGSIKSSEDNFTSMRRFVAGLTTMAELQHKTQVPVVSLKNWPTEFEKQRRNIIELWDACNISLVHRTYFFLLFKGDPTDSVYMEVELRRLCFLNDAFSQGTPTKSDGQDTTPASSMKALRREREMLVRQMQKKLTSGERETLYQQWGIGLDSKQRRLQLARKLWSDIHDITHVRESAGVVAKLVGLLEPGEALREMFGLSFLPHSPQTSTRWKRQSGR